MARIESGFEHDKDEAHKKLTQRMNNLGNKMYNLKVPEDLYKKVRLKLVKEDKKLRPVLIKMLEEYVKI